MSRQPWNGIFTATSFTGEGEPKIEPLELAQKARAALLSKKGQDVVLMDMRGLSNVTDYYLLATGLNPPHIRALADELERALVREGIRCFRRAGTPESGWVVADYLDAVVHIFARETRSYYALERLWNDAPRL